VRFAVFVTVALTVATEPLPGLDSCMRRWLNPKVV
jgi:hypothetical protein